MEISLILRELRTENGYTQKELAERLGITQDSISLWEKGKRIPDTPYVIALCNLFEVSADYLLGRSDDFGSAIPASSPTYSTEEQRLIESYRGLGKPLKDLLWGFIETWQAQTASSTNKKA